MTRLLTKWEPILDAAFAECAHAGEEFSWEAALGMAPQGAPAVMLFVFTPGPLLGTVIHAMAGIPHPSTAGEDDLAAVVRRLVEEVRSERSRQLAGTNGRPHVGGGGSASSGG